jgi:glycosyltransferase involved in cell wall biosynthesis
VNDPRKGIGILLDTLFNLGDKTSGIHLLIIGNGKIKNIPIPHTYIGGINNETLMSFIYSACDLFWCPSLQDNLPNTVLESISCGTPVLAFNIGGMPDMIIDEGNGFLVSYLEGAAAKTMKEKLEYIFIKYRLKENCKENAHFPSDNFTLNSQAHSYLRLYSKSG